MNRILLIITSVPIFLIAVVLIINVIVKMELETEVIINAPREKVWNVLIDNERYSEWNPFIISSTGEIRQGSRITNVMVNQGKETTFTPVIKIYDDYERIEWLGTGISGMFKGRHYFYLSDTDDGNTKMVHGEKFSGFLAGVILLVIGEDTRINFEAMNEAMKERAENPIEPLEPSNDADDQEEDQ